MFAYHNLIRYSMGRGKHRCSDNFPSRSLAWTALRRGSTPNGQPNGVSPKMPFAHQVDKSLDSTIMSVAVRKFNKRSGKASTLQVKWTRWKDAPTRPKAGHLSVALFKNQAPRNAEPGRRSSRRGEARVDGWNRASQNGGKGRS